MQQVNYDQLRIERMQLGWTQAEVAKALGITTKTLRRWEQGQSAPYPYYRNQLSILFGKTAQQLGLKDEDDTSDYALKGIKQEWKDMLMRQMNLDRLRTERIRHGWTQAEVAKALGISTKTVRRWEQGLCVPYPYYRKRLSMLFGKTTQHLGLKSADNAPREFVRTDELKSADNAPREFVRTDELKSAGNAPREFVRTDELEDIAFQSLSPTAKRAFFRGERES